MSASDKSQRTEKPTPKRRREARREGRIARTPELVTWASVLATTVVAPGVFRNVSRSLVELTGSVERAAGHPDVALALPLLGGALARGLLALAPLALVLSAVGIAGNLAQVGFAPTTHTLKPKFSKLNPFPGVKRLFSPTSAWEAGKNLVKFTILGFVGWRMLSSIVPSLVDSGHLALPTVIAATAARTIAYVRTAAAVGLVLAAIDYGLQRRRIEGGMRMTKEEIRQEARQSEGDPHMKGKIRERQRRMSRLRMMADVARADVVIVNPVHVAVALRYEPDRGAPRVLAKGSGEVAARIREEAERHAVPLVENVALARTLHRVCDIGDEIPGELYEAVARVLAFVFALRSRGRASGGHHHVPGVFVPVLAARRRSAIA